MVTTEYHGRNGNNLFQYVFARLLAEKNGLAMMTEWNNSAFIQEAPHKNGITNMSAPKTVISDFYRDERVYQGWLAKDYSNQRIHCKGFFQFPEAYWNDRENIRNMFVDKFPCTEPDSIAMHMRFGDYFTKDVASVIHPSWYLSCLQRLKYRPNTRRLYIICDERNCKLIQHYAQFRPEIVCTNPREDFKLLASCGTVICANSSFSWWAAFLGHPTTVFTFGPVWMRYSPYVKLYNTPTWNFIPGGFIGANFKARG